MRKWIIFGYPGQQDIMRGKQLWQTRWSISVMRFFGTLWTSIFVHVFRKTVTYSFQSPTTTSESTKKSFNEPNFIYNVVYYLMMSCVHDVVSDIADHMKTMIITTRYLGATIRSIQSCMLLALRGRCAQKLFTWNLKLWEEDLCMHAWPQTA